MVSRRNFLSGKFKSSPPPLRPPWALAEPLFLKACTRCGKCAAACPTAIITVRSGYPEVDFGKGACSFCGDCAKACVDGALQNSELQLWPWAVKAQVANSCLATRGVECRVCSERCEPQAIRFSPRLGGPGTPQIDLQSCTGCGACVAPCPASAITIA